MSVSPDSLNHKAKLGTEPQSEAEQASTQLEHKWLRTSLLPPAEPQPKLEAFPEAFQEAFSEAFPEALPEAFPGGCQEGLREGWESGKASGKVSGKDSGRASGERA